MANKVVFEVVVSDGGTTKITQKGIESLGASVDKTTKKTREASKAQDELNYRLNQGATGVSSAARSFSKLNQAIGAGPNGLVGAYAALAANAFAVSAAFNSLRSAQQAQMVLEGLEVQGAKTGRTLTVAADKLREVVGYGISAQESMAATAQLSAAGFSTEELERLGAVAQNTSLALGRNLPDSLDRLIKGTTKLEPELLDELGIMTKLSEATTAYALQTGKSANSLSQFEKRQAFLNAILAEGELKFGGISDAIDTNPYDKLAGAFNDLTNSSLNFVNNSLGLVNVIELLANNTTALAGVLVLFGSTIQKSLLGSLNDLSAQSVKAAEEARNLAAAARTAAADEMKAAKVKQLAALQESRNIELHSKSAKAIKDRADAIKEGTLSEQEFERVLKANERSIASHTAIVERDKKAGADTSSREQLIKELEDQGIALQTLRKSEADYANNTTKIQGAALSNMRAEFALTRKARAQDSAAAAIQAASNLELGATFNSLALAVRNYSIAVQLETKDTLTAAAASNVLASTQVRLLGIYNAGRVAAFAAATGIKALAGAFLKLIPVIGIAMVAVDMIREGWDWVASKIWPNSTKAQKELTEAGDEYNKILETQSKALEAYNKIQGSTASASSRATEAILNEANSLIELAEGYQKVLDAQKKRANATDAGIELGSSSSVGLNKKTVEERAQMDRARNWGISIDSLTMSIGQKVMDASQQRLGSWFRENDEEAQTFISTLSTLEGRLGKEGLTRAIVGAAGSLEKFKNMMPNKAAELLNNILQDTAKQQHRVRDAVESLNAAFKSGETAANKFLKDAIGATPFDDIVTSFEDINKNIRVLQREGKSAFEQLQLISGIGPELQKFLNPSDSALLDTIREADIVYQSLVGKQNSLVGIEKQRFEEAKRVLQANEENLPRLKKALELAESENKVRQASVALAKAQASIIQAQLSKYSEFLNSGAAGMRAQIKAQREINELNAAAQKAQKAIIDSMIAQEELKIRNVENEIAELKAKQENLSLDKQKTLEMARQYQIWSNMSQFGPLKDGYVVNPNVLDPNKAVQEAQTAIDQDQQKLDELNDKLTTMQNSLRAARIQSDALQKAIVAATMSSLTKEQETAKARVAAIDAENKVRADTRKTQDETAKAQALSNTLEATRNGLLDTTEYKLKQINNEYESGIRSLDELTDQKNLLAAQRAYAAAMLTTAPASMRQGILENIAAIDKQMIAMTNQEQVMRQALDNQRELNIQQLIGLSTVRERIEAQKELLSYAQKEMDTWQALQEIKYSNLQMPRNILAEVTGATVDNSVKDAQEALTRAKEVSELRKVDIDLEYALLEEQRRLMAEDFRRRAEIASSKGQAEKASQLNTLADVADASAENVASARQNAIAAVTATVEQKELDLAKARITQYSNTLIENFKKLGPDGEAALAVFSGMSQISFAVLDAMDQMGQAGTTTTDKIAAIAGAASQAIGAVAAMLSANSAAKIASIDKEIAAEEKRDGKSAQSVAKLEALEKKKDAMARKQFNINKKLMMAQAVMSTAAGVAGALGSAPFGPWNIAMAAIVGAMGAAQIGLIAGTQYESSYTPKSVAMPSTLSIGKRGDTVDLARGPNANAGGEVGYLRGSAGTGTSAANYRTVGSAYGGDLMRGYGNRGFVVGEKGPEVISPETPINVTPANDVAQAAPINASISIQALDAQGVEEVLNGQKGNIIKMLREAANASGQRFLEDVNVNVYTRPNISRL